MTTIDRTALLLVIVGALDWGLVGAFQLDLVAAIFGGQAAPLARVVYVPVARSSRVPSSSPFDFFRRA